MAVELSDDRAQAASWLRGQIRLLAPSDCYLDAFPCGLLGELDADFWCESLSNLPITHLARLLRFDRFKTLIPERPIKLDWTLILEGLTSEHRRYVAAVSIFIFIETSDWRASAGIDVEISRSYIVMHQSSGAPPLRRRILRSEE
ncbi:MAG: hypothetical protein K2X93_19055 [Candidatus Obscuribacterales bacterium]|nr:hypothetical protein [Candidatus Obscuribacterales bacterium]